MRFILSSLVCALALSACGGPSQTPEQRAQSAANKAATAQAVKNAKTASVNGKAFRVAERRDKGYALVELQGSAAPYTALEVERAAASATGCGATFEPGILAFVGGDVRKADLGALRKKVSGNFNGWRVNLKC
ncbi:hypothetical protein ABMC88_12785 [Sulfitobacter sp. HNIBRBA2951]|uniref:hypothetical protein n=1 Tax=Sulfitobacter aquimarinus TaxID=3158557 RepID=UPI0032DF0FCB